jgi:NAD(P)-dependent dehydrogenase (short-subunit alcohol dehydrogenase family)
MQKSILITGCSSGIGLHAAQTLRERGWLVFAACRKPEDCARLTEEGFIAPLLDYEKPETIETALAEVLGHTGGTLYGLFNNGAYAIPGYVEDIPTDALRQIFEANFFGHHTLTRAVMPVMRAQRHGRIVQCSSVLGFVAMPWRGAYCATKFALEGLTDALRLELRDTQIYPVLIQPGAITSKFRENALAQIKKWIDTDNGPHAPAYAKMLDRYEDFLAKAPFQLEPADVTKKLILALEASKPKAHYRVTAPTHATAVLKRILPTSAMDFVASRT